MSFLEPEDVVDQLKIYKRDSSDIVLLKAMINKEVAKLFVLNQTSEVILEDILKMDSGSVPVFSIEKVTEMGLDYCISVAKIISLINSLIQSGHDVLEWEEVSLYKIGKIDGLKILEKLSNNMDKLNEAMKSFKMDEDSSEDIN